MWSPHVWFFLRQRRGSERGMKQVLIYMQFSGCCFLIVTRFVCSFRHVFIPTLKEWQQKEMGFQSSCSGFTREHSSACHNLCCDVHEVGRGSEMQLLLERWLIGTAGMERRWNCNCRDGLDIRSGHGASPRDGHTDVFRKEKVRLAGCCEKIISWSTVMMDHFSDSKYCHFWILIGQQLYLVVWLVVITSLFSYKMCLYSASGKWLLKLRYIFYTIRF